jgi:hypothetical protein
MRRYLPGYREFVLFAVLAVIGASIAGAFGSHQLDTAMTLIVFPLFTFCAILGLHKSGRLRRID